LRELAYDIKGMLALGGVTTPAPTGLIQSVSQVSWPGLSAWVEVGGIALFLCSKAFLPQPIST
jgi:hypothetical protein